MEWLKGGPSTPILGLPDGQPGALPSWQNNKRRCYAIFNGFPKGFLKRSKAAEPGPQAVSELWQALVRDVEALTRKPITMRYTPLILLALTSLCFAISPHRLSLESVLKSAEWVAVATAVEVEEFHRAGGSGLAITVNLERNLKGRSPASPVRLVYWEPDPQVDPDGKTEAPIWTGSSLERRLRAGQSFLALGRGLGLSRAEPLEAEERIQQLLKPSPLNL